MRQLVVDNSNNCSRLEVEFEDSGCSLSINVTLEGIIFDAVNKDGDVVGTSSETYLEIYERLSAQVNSTEPEIFAQRIFDYINNLHPAIKMDTTVYQHIISILKDPYAHLDAVQRERIRDMTASVMAAGDGGENTMSYAESRGQISDWSIEDMLHWVHLDGEGLRKRLDFNPETGNKWEEE